MVNLSGVWSTGTYTRRYSYKISQPYLIAGLVAAASTRDAMGCSEAL